MDTIAALGIELDQDLQVIERINQTVIDVLSDIGGLVEVLFVMIAGILSIINY